MVNKFEAIGILACVGVMAVALFLLRLDGQSDLLGSIDANTQAASVVSTADSDSTLSESLAGSITSRGTVRDLIIDDITEGEGEGVTKGDTITVHYIGTLQNGQQFDNSYVRGEPFTFEIGTGHVIKGWDQGLLGMKEGGQRILVVPSELAYGGKGMGPIPSNAALVFAVELIEVK